MIEQNDEWLVGHRYLGQHSLEPLLADHDPDQEEREEDKEVLALTAA